MIRLRLPLVSLLALLLAAGCSSVKRDSSIHATARFASPTDILIEWHDPVPGAAGHTVEFTTDLKSEFVTLGFVQPETNRFLHPRLMPETTFYYRVGAYYGPVSKPVEVRLPESLSDAEYTNRYAKPEDYGWAIPQTNAQPASIVKQSIRNPATAAAGAPTGLDATLMTNTVSGFLLTWTDHDSDGDGYLLEVKEEGSPGFEVCALLPPCANSFGWGFHPPERKATYRVRAFYYGAHSSIVSQTTGKTAPAAGP